VTTDPTKPLVSVLSPSFNQGRWLEANLASVAGQTYPRVEHIVMDGGSTDHSVEVLEAAGGHVHWRSEPDAGQSNALNKALAASSGEIIGWLNSDDAYSDPGVVEAVVEEFARHPEVDLIYGHALLVNADGLVLQTIWAPPFVGSLFRYSNFIIQPAAFVRRSSLRGRMADEAFDYTMDRELWLRLAQTGRARRINRVVAIDRHHRDRKSYQRMDLFRADEQRLRQMYGVPLAKDRRVRMKATKILLRLAGLSLVRRVSDPAVFGGVIDGRWRLAARQALMVRSRMPEGSRA
jgi:glycosyltransferase involved in cell wall biosynthesis